MFTLFQELGNFALTVLSLPHSNAACERCFSKINLIKTKIRNRLLLPTLNGLLLASQCAKDGGSSSTFPVTEDMIAAMNVDNLKPKKKQEQEVVGAAELQMEEEEFDLVFS